jgi:hypothetical protein
MKRYILMMLIALLAVPVISQAQQSTIQDARVGEWAVYQTGNGNMQERHTVIARKQNVIVVKIDKIVNGRTISSNTENYNVDAPPFLNGASGRSNVQAGGNNYNAITVSRGPRTFYYSNQVPVTGLVLVKNGNNVVKEIVNFGR